MVVARGDEGGLGVVVDQDNVVVTVTAQPALQVDDVITAVDGKKLEGFIGASGFLTPGTPEYTFSIVRQGAAGATQSLELNLMKLIKEAEDVRLDDRRAQFEGRIFGLLCMDALGDGAEAFAKQANNFVASLEAADLQPASPEALGEALNSGFWKLVLTSSERTAKEGLTGYGSAPFCTVLASYQAFLPQGTHRAVRRSRCEPKHRHFQDGRTQGRLGVLGSRTARTAVQKATAQSLTGRQPSRRSRSRRAGSAPIFRPACASCACQRRRRSLARLSSRVSGVFI